MDDQRPMSGGEKVFFSSGTGSGIFIIYLFWKVSDIFYSSSACYAYFHQVWFTGGEVLSKVATSRKESSRG